MTVQEFFNEKNPRIINNSKVTKSTDFNGNTVYFVENETDSFLMDKYFFLDCMEMQKTLKEALEIEKIIYCLFPDSHYNVFYDICYDIIYQKAKSENKDEFYFQDLFKEKCSSLGLGEIVYHKNNPKHIPDAWVNRNGELIPVEVKVSDFNKKALKQLNRYMNVYNTKRGIAVARRLTVELPNNIEFVPFDKFTDK